MVKKRRRIACRSIPSQPGGKQFSLPLRKGSGDPSPFGADSAHRLGRKNSSGVGPPGDGNGIIN